MAGFKVLRRVVTVTVLLLFSIQPVRVGAVEYIYHDVTADTAPTRYCYPEKKAKALTSDRYNLDRYSKKFCSALGEGWHVDKRKSDGNAVCTLCTGIDQGLHRCAMQRVEVICKQIVPGSLAPFKPKQP